MPCPDHIKNALNVSRETLTRLETLADLLVKWNPRINLVSKTTIDDLWTRHILDSVQVLRCSPSKVDHWVDIGSGGGFPGLAIALSVGEPEAPKKVTLIESDQRKCAFLRTVLRETGVSATVITDRIEKAAVQNADVLSPAPWLISLFFLTLQSDICAWMEQLCSRKAQGGKKNCVPHRNRGHLIAKW
jgi:16S rRNA (guanine527-N7)-methyltransferase